MNPGSTIAKRILITVACLGAGAVGALLAMAVVPTAVAGAVGAALGAVAVGGYAWLTGRRQPGAAGAAQLAAMRTSRWSAYVTLERCDRTTGTWLPAPSEPTYGYDGVLALGADGLRFHGSDATPVDFAPTMPVALGERGLSPIRTTAAVALGVGAAFAGHGETPLALRAHAPIVAVWTDTTVWVFSSDDAAPSEALFTAAGWPVPPRIPTSQMPSR